MGNANAIGSKNPAPELAPVALEVWVLSCSLLGALGWILSALGQLNAKGYSIGLGVMVSLITCFSYSFRPRRFINWPGFRRRFRRPFPAAYFLLAGLALAGGILYMPSNYDALAYRTPRVLSWLAEKHWYWIPDARGWHNTRATGFEWLTAPILLFAKTDRLLFLLNFVSFLLLPGLVFSLLHRLGISKRLAWHWMWVFPSGLCFALQAGSVANDLYGVVLALASVVFALQAKERQSVRHLFFSCIAAALMTNAKSSNLPLLLPWSIAVLPSLHLFWRNLMPGFIALVLGLVCSLLPNALLNINHTGDWTGLKAEDAWMHPPSATSAIAYNIGLLSLQNLSPPIFPVASAWNSHLPRIMPDSWKVALDGFAEGGWGSYKLRELAGEEYAGLGSGVCLLLMFHFVCGVQRFRVWKGRPGLWNRNGVWRLLLILSPFLALTVFMAKSGIAAPSRLIAPYYGLLLPAVLCFSNSEGLASNRVWRTLAWFSFNCAAVVLILSPARPLWPARTLISAFRESLPGHLAERLTAVYGVYQHRGDCYEELRKRIPDSARAVGLVAFADPETSLWRPFGSRRVSQVLRSTTRNELRDMDFVVVNLSEIKPILGIPFEDWLSVVNGTVVAKMPIRILASGEPVNYALVKPMLPSINAKHSAE